LRKSTISLSETKEICYELLRTVAPRAEELQKLAPKKYFTAWTSAVKAILEEIGKKKYASIYSSPEKYLHEFLVDFTWWDEVNKVTILACECEFGNTWDEAGNPERVGEDFDKLLSVKALFKLMIFDSYGSKKRGNQLQKIIERLNKSLSEFGQHVAGEIYIALDTCDMNNLERPRLWQCVIEHNGADESLMFIEIAKGA
jgi:hypothetical protein